MYEVNLKKKYIFFALTLIEYIDVEPVDTRD